MNDRDFMEFDLQGIEVNYYDPEIPKQLVNKSRNEIVKANKLVNGYYEEFLPSYLESFSLKSDNNVEAYKSYVKMGYAIQEIIEFIDIFSGESVYDLDKAILETNLNSLKLLCDERIKQIKKSMEVKV